MEEDIVLDVKNLSVEFFGNVVLDDLNFSVKRGEVLAIVGPNGSGKSVLFRSLLGLVPHTGKIDWKPGIKIGYVPQKLAIEHNFPLTVREFLEVKSKNGTAYGINDIYHALNSVGIKTGSEQEYHLEHHILNRPLGKLSGGELQRILIAWSMIGKPDVLLFDEPTTGIDIGGEGTIYDLLRKLQMSNTLTIILISHDLNIIYKYTDIVLCLNKKMLGYGKPDIVLTQDKLSSLYGGETEIIHHKHGYN
jgi:zinc transport system ATP-binding protein